jgi:uncharacterized protein
MRSSWNIDIRNKKTTFILTIVMIILNVKIRSSASGCFLRELSLTYSRKNLYNLNFCSRSFKMKILIADIPDEGMDLDMEEKFGAEELSLVSPVKAHLELTKAHSEIIIAGTVNAELELECSRCLKKYRRTMHEPVHVVYHPLEELGIDRHELTDDEMDMGFYQGEELDLRELVREQVMLNIQMKPLCDENCKGICSQCGTDLNTDTCSCKTEKIDSRLEVLKKLLEK